MEGAWLSGWIQLYIPYHSKALMNLYLYSVDAIAFVNTPAMLSFLVTANEGESKNRK
jgi:hypothetical protein